MHERLDTLEGVLRGFSKGLGLLRALSPQERPTGGATPSSPATAAFEVPPMSASGSVETSEGVAAFFAGGGSVRMAADL